jgi:L-fuculose-phosphate aldolase
LPEVVITLGGIPTAPYATPGTLEVPEAIRGFIQDYDALLLSRHGAMTVGRDVVELIIKWKLEHTARVVLAARLQGPVSPLPEAEVEMLRRIGKKYRGGGVG